MNKIILLSGGLDSVTLLHFLMTCGKGALPTHALIFDYGQRHNKEVALAEYWASRFRLTYSKIDISFLSEITKNVSLLSGTKETDDLTKSYVPFRNTIFLSLAASYAESVGADTIYYAAHKEDVAGYWDCTRDYVDRLNYLFELNKNISISVVTPFRCFTKKEIVSVGLEMDVPFDLTWSCYLGEDNACGKCPACLLRLDAFRANNIKDPIPYAESD